MRSALVADDSVAVRRLIAARLSHDGYEVREAEDGLDALRQAEARPPDVLIVDDVLPCLAGVELVAALHERFPADAPPVIFLYEYPAGLARASMAGIPERAVVRKPLELDELAARVQEATSR